MLLIAVTLVVMETGSTAIVPGFVVFLSGVTFSHAFRKNVSVAIYHLDKISIQLVTVHERVLPGEE